MKAKFKINGKSQLNSMVINGTILKKSEWTDLIDLNLSPDQLSIVDVKDIVREKIKTTKTSKPKKSIKEVSKEEKPKEAPKENLDIISDELDDIEE